MSSGKEPLNLAPCPNCGAKGSQTHGAVFCDSGACRMSGPWDDFTGAKWNALAAKLSKATEANLVMANQMNERLRFQMASLKEDLAAKDCEVRISQQAFAAYKDALNTVKDILRKTGNNGL